jgi:hypothetical protein
MAPDDPVARLVAEAEIRAVVMRYCRAIDRLDMDLLRSCYHPDAVDEHGTFTGTVDEYVAWVDRVLRRYDSTMHVVANHLAELDSPTSARAETYGFAFHHTDDGDERRNLTMAFRFVDRFELRSGRWAIARRVAVTEWVRRTDPASWWPSPEGVRVGRRDREDAVYWV